MLPPGGEGAAVEVQTKVLLLKCKIATHWYYSKAHVMQRTGCRLVHVISQLSEYAMHILEGQG